MRELSVALPSVVDISNPPGNIDYSVLSKIGGVIKFPRPLVNPKGQEWRRLNPDKVGYKDMQELWCSEFIILPTPSYQENGLLYLNSIQRAANNLIRACEANPDPTEEQDWLQEAFNNLVTALREELCGKRGLLSRYLAGYRIQNSITFVSTGSPKLKNDEIELPKKYADSADIKEGDIVMYCRHPVLHEDSVRFGYARISMEANTGALPYLNFKGLGADNDGDLIVAFKIPEDVLAIKGVHEAITTDIEVSAQRSEMFGSMLLYKGDPKPDLQEYFVSVCPDCSHINKLEANDKRECIECGTILRAGSPIDFEYMDLEERLQEDGLSFGPEDMFEESELLKQMSITGAKKIKDNFRDIFEGNADLIESAAAVVEEQMSIKLKLGLVGRTGSDALVAANFTTDNSINRSACYLKEKLSQQILDCKHGEDVSNMDEMLDALAKRGDYKNSSLNEVLALAESFGYDTDLIAPILRYTAPRGMRDWVNLNAPMLRLLSNGTLSQVFRIEEGKADNEGLGRYIYRVLEKHEVLGGEHVRA